MLINFECFCSTQWGQNLFVSGSSKELGAWDVNKAVPLNFTGQDEWQVKVKIDTAGKQPVEYKYFIREAATGAIYWEQGKNRVLEVEPSRFKTAMVIDFWSGFGNDQYTWASSAFTRVLFKRSDKAESFVLPEVNEVVQFKLTAPRVGRKYAVGIVGNCDAFGNWKEKGLLKMNGADYPVWRAAIPKSELPEVLEYKFVVYEKKSGKVTTWEGGGNRRVVAAYLGKNEQVVVNEGFFRFPDCNLKGAGVSVPVFSLRSASSFGTGEFTDLKGMIDWCDKTGLKMLQVLPVNDTISTHSFLDSYPYKAISVFALHPMFLNIFEVGSVADENMMNEYKHYQWELNQKESVDYEQVVKLKLRYAKQLFAEQKSSFLKSADFKKFFKANQDWLVPYAAFSYLRDLYGTSDFNQWPAYAQFNKSEIEALVSESQPHYDEVAKWYFIQYHLDRQLRDASEYGRQKGVVMKGDIPIGISRYSVDAWFEPRLYHFDGQAGAPPDDFSADGQNWGFPTYNWQEMAKDNFKWWQNRLTKMADYFDAYRIDHILGFFRIWEIPFDAVQGVLGHFRPSLSISYGEFESKGVYVDYNRMCKPYIREHFLGDIFGEYTDDVKWNYLVAKGNGVYELKPEFATQRLIYDRLVGEAGPEALGQKESKIFYGLLRLAAEVVLLPADEHSFYPRVSMHSTYSFRELDGYVKSQLDKIYIDFYYHRHEYFWKDQALQKIPALVDATDMLICGEDLGMVPASVPGVMKQFGILSLEIQRMPKDPEKQFAHPADAPYLSVCTTSTHDMATIRGWWEEKREVTQVFFNQQLGNWGEMPFFAEPWVCKDMINQHLYSPAMWTVFPIQDLLAMDGELRSPNTHGEKINEPANPRHYWKYRMHLSVDDLMNAEKFNGLLAEMVKATGRNEEY
jgi:4-alpha-glucanotransferase